MTSYRKDGTVGPWAEEKLQKLEKYLNAYTTVLSKQAWCDAYIYIDAFAGAGRAPLRKYGTPENEMQFLEAIVEGFEDDKEFQEYVEGSPVRALSLKRPFTNYLFIESDVRKAVELEARIAKTPNGERAYVRNCDANTAIQDFLAKREAAYWKTRRAVAFLDPFGAQLNWKTIHELANTQAVEVIINFPMGMALQRLLPQNPSEMRISWKEKLNECLGSNDWFDIVYQRQVGFFGDDFSKDTKAGEQLSVWFSQRLSEVFGFASEPYLIRNHRGGHLYYLMWAGPKKAGLNIAKDVLA